jgi:uncharacterized protein (TIGR00369 family)
MAAQDDLTVERAANALGVPLLRFLDVSAINLQDPRSGVSLTPAANVMNAVDLPHAGAMSTILEIAAYLALLPDLSPDEEAVSHALFASYVARAKGAAPLIARGQVVRRTGRLAFMTAEITQEGRPLATAHVTKTIYPRGGR